MTDLIDALLKHYPEVPNNKWPRILGISPATFSHWKTGRRAVPDEVKEAFMVLISMEDVAEDLGRFLAAHDAPLYFSTLKCLINNVRTISAVPVVGETIINKVLKQERRKV